MYTVDMSYSQLCVWGTYVDLMNIPTFRLCHLYLCIFNTESRVRWCLHDTTMSFIPLIRHVYFIKSSYSGIKVR